MTMKMYILRQLLMMDGLILSLEPELRAESMAEAEAAPAADEKVTANYP